MAQSPEYPDLAFVQPRAYGIGRDGRSVQYVVIHYTAGSERATSAEDGAAYDQKRQDGTSCHYFHDQNSTVQCVLTPNRANSALAKGNRLGIQHELCGTVQTREQWLDPASDGTLWRAARQVARDCRKYGIPARRLSVAEVRAAWYGTAKPKGICGHADVTLAYPEDGGDHMDPGAAFPWDVLLERVTGYLEYGDDWNGADMGIMEEALAWQSDAVAFGKSAIADGPQKGLPVVITQTINTLALDVAAIKATLAASGGSPELAPVMAAIAALTAKVDALAANAVEAARAGAELAEDS